MTKKVLHRLRREVEAHKKSIRKTHDREAEQFYRAVGAKISEARECEEMTQQDVADAVGHSRASIANIESGKQRSPMYVFALVADAVNRKLRDLLP